MRESPSLHDAHRTQVDGYDVMAVLCQKHAVATFAITQTECATGWQLLHHLAKKVIRVGTEGKAVFGVPFVPRLTARCSSRHGNHATTNG